MIGTDVLWRKITACDQSLHPQILGMAQPVYTKGYDRSIFFDQFHDVPDRCKSRIFHKTHGFLTRNACRFI